MGNPMFSLDSEMLELIFEYCRKRLELDPVALDFGGIGQGFDTGLDGLIGPDGNDVVKVLRLFEEQLALAIISVDSPRYLSFIPAAPTKAALLFDMIVSCSSLIGTSWLEAAGAVVAENQALAVIAAKAGLGPGAGGCFVAGGTAGNLSALVVARDSAHRRGKRVDGRLRIAVSEEAHSSVGRALAIIGVDPLVVASDDHRLTGTGLRAALEHDGDPDSVVAVVATAGTTNAGIVDELDPIAEVAREYGLWMHVDGAYGGGGLFSDRERHRYVGIERADSLVIDPHKWLFAPFDCAALLYAEPRLAKAVHTQDASYLDVLHDQAGWNPSDYAIHLTRRARGLPLWFSLAVHGTDAYRDAVDAAFTLARQTARLVEQNDHLSLLREPELSIVLFRRQGWTRADYDHWSEELLRNQQGFVTPTSWEGEPAARFCFLHPDATIEIVEEILSTMA